MKEYSIEIVTNDTSCSEIEVEALHVEKLDHHNVIIDGAVWNIPDVAGMSFARVEEVEK